MLSTIDAIILSFQPVSDKAHLVHAYTRTGGRFSYRVYGIGKKNSAGTYHPLSVVQLVTDGHSVREARLNYVPATLTTDLYKQTVALFISEVLYHVLRHPMPDEPMYDFLEEAVRALDSTDEPQQFHIRFLVSFAARLDFALPDEELFLSRPPITRKERQQSLRALCDYFAEHVETWETPRSLDILMEVFN